MQPEFSGRAADVPLIPRETLFGNPERTPAQLSPDGKHLAFLAPLDGLLNVFVAPIDDLNKAQPVTHETDRPVSGFGWSPDSTMILYPKDTGGDENDHLLCVSAEGGEARDLTPFPGANSGILKTSRHHKGSMLVASNKRDPQFFDPYRLDLATGALTLLLENKAFAGFLADSGLILRIAVAPRPDGGVDYYRIVDGVVEDGPFEQVDYEDARTTGPAGFSDDGTILYWTDARGRDKTALIAQDLATGERSLLAADEHADIDGVLLDPRTDRPLAYAATYLKSRYVALDPSIQPDLDFLDTAFEGGSWAVVSQDEANEIWTIVNDPVVAPAAVHLYWRASKALKPLYTIRPALEGMPLVPMTPLETRSRDGLTLVSYLSLPAHYQAEDAEKAPLPLVLDVHGGPWARDYFGYNSNAPMARQSRLCGSVGQFPRLDRLRQSLCHGGDGQWGARMQDDLFDVIDALVGRGLIDPEKVAILGGSYGGYAVLAGLAFTPKRFACGVDIVGVSELSTLLASIPPYWEPLRAMFQRAVGDPTTEEGKALLTERSPLHKASAIERPLLIGHGANDPRVKQAESDQIAEALRAQGTPFTYILYPDEGHGFQRPTNRIAFWAITENFLANYLGGRAEPIGDALAASSTIVKAGADHVAGLAEAAAKMG